MTKKNKKHKKKNKKKKRAGAPAQSRQNPQPAPSSSLKKGKSVSWLGFCLFFAVGFGLSWPVAQAVRERSAGPALLKPSHEESAAKPETANLVKPGPKPAPKVAPKPARPPMEDLLKAEDLFQQGYQSFLAERYGAAHEAFEQAAELAPIDCRPLVFLGKVSQALDYSQRAMRYYRQAIDLEPMSPSAHDARSFLEARILLARLLCDFGRNKESMALLERARKDSPGDTRVWAGIAVNMIRMGQPQAAIPMFERYNAKEGEQAWGIVHLGKALFDAGRVEEGEAMLRKAVTLDPRGELPNLWLSQLLVATDREAEAEAYVKTFQKFRRIKAELYKLEQAVARRPDEINQHVMMLVRVAHLRELLGRSRQALIPLQRAMQLLPDDIKLKQLYQRQARRAEDK